MNVLQTLETLLRSVSSAPPIVAEIEKILLPMLALTIQHDFVGESVCQAVLRPAGILA